MLVNKGAQCPIMRENIYCALHKNALAFKKCQRNLTTPQMLP